MFRREVRLAQQEKLYGNISLAQPVPWHVISYGLFLLFVTATGFLALGAFARVEAVDGQIKPDLGVAIVTPSRPGIVTGLLVNPGDDVGASQPLAKVRVDEVGLSGVAGADDVLSALNDQVVRLGMRERSVQAGAEQIKSQLAARSSGFRAELAALAQQSAMQERLVEVAEADMDRAKQIFERGFLSRRDLQASEERLVARRQQLSALNASRAEKNASMIEALRSADQAENTTAATVAAIAGDRAVVLQRKVEIEAGRGYTVPAPIAGRVTAITARVGQTVQSNIPLMMIVPKSSRLEAELYVPTRAAGFLQVGQEVRLQIAAFPYERFGTISARLTRISAATVDRVASNGMSEAVYLVTASLPKAEIFAFRRSHPLQAGMALTARIVTEKRSLWEWLFEPIIAMKKR